MKEIQLSTELDGLKELIYQNTVRTQEIKKLTEQLSQTEYFMESILRNTPDLIYIYDIQSHKNIWSNNKLEEMVGYNQDEIINMGSDVLSFMMHPDDYDYYLKNIMPLYNEMYDDDTITHTLRYKHKYNDDWVYLKTRETVFSRDENNKIKNILGIQTDVTEEMNNLKEIRIQAEALNAASNAIIMTDSKGKIIFANKALLINTGYKLYEVIGQNPKIFKSGKHDNEFYANMWQTILSGKIWSGNIINKTKSGELTTEHTTITPIRNGVINYFIAIKEYI